MSQHATDWRAALRRLIDQHPRGMTGVADDAAALGLKGFGRVYISRVFMQGGNRIEHPGKAFVANVWALVGQVHCPHLNAAITTQQCRAHSGKTYAQTGVARLGPQTTVAHWRACQACPFALHAQRLVQLTPIQAPPPPPKPKRCAMHTFDIRITLSDGSSGRHQGQYPSGCSAVLAALAWFPDARRISARSLP